MEYGIFRYKWQPIPRGLFFDFWSIGYSVAPNLAYGAHGLPVATSSTAIVVAIEPLSASNYSPHKVNPVTEYISKVNQEDSTFKNLKPLVNLENLFPFLAFFTFASEYLRNCYLVYCIHCWYLYLLMLHVYVMIFIRNIFLRNDLFIPENFVIDNNVICEMQNFIWR